MLLTKLIDRFSPESERVIVSAAYLDCVGSGYVVRIYENRNWFSWHKDNRFTWEIYRERDELLIHSGQRSSEVEASIAANNHWEYYGQAYPK